MTEGPVPVLPSRSPEERPPAVTYIGTGFGELDRLLAGGVKPGELTVFAARGPSYRLATPARPWPFMSTQVLK